MNRCDRVRVPAVIHWRWRDAGYWRVVGELAAVLEKKRVSNAESRRRKKASG